MKNIRKRIETLLSNAEKIKNNPAKERDRLREVCSELEDSLDELSKYL